MIFKVLMKVFFQLISIALILFVPLSASGHIPSANFIIKMMLKGNHAVENIKIEQIATLFDINTGHNDLMVPEVLYLRVPDDYRLDIAFPEEHKTFIHSEGKILIIVGGKVIGNSKDEKSIFKDFFIKRSVDEIIGLLRSRNVDIERRGLGRFNGKIAYIIGAKEREAKLPQLWIEKDTFLPLRFIVEEKKEDSTAVLEIRYLDYINLDDKYRYPYTMEFYYNNKLTLRYEVQKVVVNTQIPDDIFDVSKVKENHEKINDER